MILSSLALLKSFLDAGNYIPEGAESGLYYYPTLESLFILSLKISQLLKEGTMTIRGSSQEVMDKRWIGGFIMAAGSLETAF